MTGMNDLPTENNIPGDRFIDRLKISDMPRILIVSLIIGLAVRLIFIPLLAYEYDNYYWALIIENINSGNGLYEIKGMYYTPVWGYILGFYDVIWSYISPTGELGIRVTELLGIEMLDYGYHTATIASPGFVIGLKIILTVVDALVGYLLYKLVLEITNDRKKSALAFALWFICPIVVYMSGIQVMFDSLSALMLLLSIILLRRDSNLMCGLVLGLACLLKVFPAICVPIFIMYLVIKNKEDTKRSAEKICAFIAGGLISFAVVLIPNMAEGNIDKTFLFLTTRLFTSEGPSMFFYAIIIATIIFVILIIILMKHIGPMHIDEHLNKIILVSLILAIIATKNPGPQYCIVFIPLLILEITTKDRSYTICWWLIGIATTFKAVVMNNFGLFCMSAAYYHLVPYDWIISMTSVFDNKVGDTTLLNLLNTIGDIFYDIGMVLILLFCIKPLADRFWPYAGSIIGKIKTIAGGHDQ